MRTIIRWIGGLSLIFFAVIFVASIFEEIGPKDEATIEKERIERIARKMAGFHCLNSWDGSHNAIKKFVKGNMRDPDSFEHIETRITPVSKEGLHSVAMKFRARNGFGGMNVGIATAKVRNEDCSAFDVEISS